MYSGGLVVDKATIGIGISLSLHNFHNRSKCAKFGVVFNITRDSLNFELPTFKNAAKYPNAETMLRLSPYFLAKFCEVGSTHP